ncbi:hypothetical protein ANCCEY_09554 [Ancylostoma ceylanicum]|uniref:Alpha-galactosidase n=1 Tax=Ancylostoma ceylanicum TaxID=53326 RepID=A0A0D6LMT4_9BILA|nr:hypothetical protein ANCCEY_09554 [Ancylostoma ceylanicum]
MGWMSWTQFRCEVNCAKYPNDCINEKLYQTMADRLVSDGYLDAGYNRIHVDDCWMAKSRDTNGRLLADPDRFPSGIKALADYVIDAATFAEWDCDYLKFDGCHMKKEEQHVGYPLMAHALNGTGRPIMFSCEWPLYLEHEQDQVLPTLLFIYVTNI